MTGFSDGVGDGESKDVVPVIGVIVPVVTLTTIHRCTFGQASLKLNVRCLS